MTPRPDPNSPQVKALVDFLINFIKALQQTSYYTGDHPAALKAREGLFRALQQCLGDKPEVSFIRRHHSDRPLIAVDGLYDEAVEIDQLVRSEENRLFLPKLFEYFSRRNLFSFTLKRNISSDEFYRFIDIMSENPRSAPSAASDLQGMAKQLQAEGIRSISVILDQESIGRGLQLPWRVEIALSRLHKDLQILPVFQRASPEKLRQIKREVVGDVLRPIRNPDAVRDILSYQDLIIAGDPQMAGLDLQQELLHAFSPAVLVLAVDLGLPPHLPPNFDRAKAERRFQEALQHAVRGELEADHAVAEALKRCLERGWLTEAQIPESIRRRAESQRLADEYLKHPRLWLEALATQAQRDTGLTPLRRLIGVIAGLIEKEQLSELPALLPLYHQLHGRLAGLPPEKAEQEQALLRRRDLWQLLCQDLSLLEEKDRQARQAVIAAFPAPFSRFVQEQVLAETEEILYRFLCELLPSLPGVEMALYDTLLSKHHDDPHHLIPALLSLSRTHLPQAGERIAPFLHHKRRSVRRETLGALFRLGREKYREGALAALKDPEPSVQAAAVRYLSALGGADPAWARSCLHLLRTTADAALTLAAIEALLRLDPNWLRGQAETEAILLHTLAALLPQSSGWLRRRVDWQPELALPFLSLLAAIGGPKIAAALESAAASPPAAWQTAVKKALAAIAPRAAR